MELNLILLQKITQTNFQPMKTIFCMPIVTSVAMQRLINDINLALYVMLSQDGMLFGNC